MGDDELLFFYAFLLLSAVYVWSRKSKRCRRYAVRPINRLRKEKGLFDNLIQGMLRQDHEYFFKYTRMTPTQFHNLLELLRTRLQKDKTKNPLPPAHLLIITLHTVSKIIKETTQAIWEVLQPLVLKEPTIEQWIATELGFFRRWNLPNTLAAVDGKHVRIQSPKYSGTEFFNYKKYFSIVIMGASDAFYKFSLIDIGAAGSNHDATIFKTSAFGHQLLRNQLPIPPPKCLSSSCATVLPHFFVADAAFPLHKNILRRFPGRQLTKEKRIFNYRLSRARRIIENAFGILTQSWRIFLRPTIANINTCEQIIMAAVVLRNYLQKSEEETPEDQRRYCPTGIVDVELPDGTWVPGSWRSNRPLHTVGRLGSNNPTQASQRNRDVLCEYMNSPEGSVSWKDAYVSRGLVPETFTMEM